MSNEEEDSDGLFNSFLGLKGVGCIVLERYGGWFECYVVGWVGLAV
jgi:hypothetical protein